MLGLATITASLKPVFALDFDVDYNHSQHLFMNVDSRHVVRHNVPPGRSGERAATALSRVTGYRRSTKRRGNAQLFAQPRTLRIRHIDSFNFSTEASISPPPTCTILTPTLSHFHEVSRAARPS